MRKRNLTISAVVLLLIFTACKKTNTTTNSGAKTVENLSGTYKITAISVTASGLTFDEFATWDACQKDNDIVLQNTMVAEFNDVGVQCAPPESATGTWGLSSNTDSLTLDGVPAFPDGLTGFITSWDGKTLILTSDQKISNQAATTSITLFKQ